MALTTGAFLSDSGNPLNANGDNGDHYRNTVNQDLWFKTGGSWTLVGNVNDDTPDGVGTFWLHGSGVPLNANGENNSYYRNTDNQDIWFKVAGIWHLLFGTTNITSATSGVRSINGIQPDAGGDVTLLVGDLGGTGPDIQAHIDAIDPHGDRAYAMGLLVGNWETTAHKSTDVMLGSSDTLYPTQKAVKGYVDQAVPRPGDTISRGAKFGNHIWLGASVPNCPYRGEAGGSQANLTASMVEGLFNRGNVSDCLLWEMNSNSNGENTEVCVFTFSDSVLYPQMQWRTGAKMQFLAHAAPAHLVPGSENFTLRIGLANVSNSDHASADPFAGYPSGPGSTYTGCAALIFADATSGYYQCKSGQKGATQTTVTTVPVVLSKFEVFHVLITTTGSVEFRINGVLVATHSGAGVIPDGAWLGEGIGIRNLAVTTVAKKGFYLDEFQFRLTLPSARPGFAFI